MFLQKFGYFQIHALDCCKILAWKDEFSHTSPYNSPCINEEEDSLSRRLFHYTHWCQNGLMLNLIKYMQELSAMKYTILKIFK